MTNLITGEPTISLGGSGWPDADGWRKYWGSSSFPNNPVTAVWSNIPVTVNNQYDLSFAIKGETSAGAPTSAWHFKVWMQISGNAEVAVTSWLPISSLTGGVWAGSWTATATGNTSFKISFSHGGSVPGQTGLYPDFTYTRNESMTEVVVNQTPVVSAGQDIAIIVPSAASLDGTVTDDAFSGRPLTTTWSKVSGPGTVTFANANAVDTTASFSTDGTYTLRLTASDTQYTVTDDVVVTAYASMPAGTSNRIQHPSANVSGALAAWTHGTSSYFDAWYQDGSYYSLTPAINTSSIGVSYSQNIPVSAGETITLLMDIDYMYSYSPSQAQLTFYNASNAQVGGWSQYLPIVTSGGDVRWKNTVSVPSGATYAKFSIGLGDRFGTNSQTIRFTNLYVGTYVETSPGATPTAPPASQPTGLDVTLEVEDTSVQANLVDNPSGVFGGAMWTGNDPAHIIGGIGTGEWTYLRFEGRTGVATSYVSDPFPINTALTYTGIRALFGGYSSNARVGISVEWLDINKALLGATSTETVTLGPGTEYNRVVSGYSAGTAYGRIRFDHYNNAANAYVNDYFEVREVTAVQNATYANVDDLQPWQAEPVFWVDVIEPAHEISIERDSVDVGLLSATVLSNTHDPAAGGIIRPGAAVRVRTFADNTWKNLYQGTISNVQTTYPKSGTRVVLSASDAMNLLSNQNEPKGVATIEGLPNILANKGVAWNANGNANQVGAVAQVSSNDSASVFDQIVITRDSDKGYAWVDVNNVLQVWNRSSMPTAPVVEFTDVANAGALYDSYSDIDLGFDTRRTINVVEITYLKYYQNEDLEWVTDEIKYGPYVDANSLKAWGAYKSVFTIHGMTEDAQTMQAFANEVLAKNATPTIKANGITVPIKDARGRAHAAAIDLYSMVGVKYSDKVDADLRVVSIKHEITPERWTAEYTFEKGDSVAVPVWTPSVT